MSGVSLHRARRPDIGTRWLWRLAGVAILASAFGCGSREDSVCTPETSAAAASWLAAVDGGRTDEALRLATAFAPREAWPARPDATSATLFTANGADPSFLAAAFNEWDFQSWSDALFFLRLSREITLSAPDAIPALFRAVTQRIHAPDPEGAGILWPRRIWATGQGYCDRQSWVLCELVWQAGGEAKIVYLRDPVTLVSPHTICQLRSGGRVWTADPLQGVLLADVSVAQLASTPELSRRMWPDNAVLQTAITAACLWVPAYPQDYCPRNQALATRLRGCLGAECPRFGEDPKTRLNSYPEDLRTLPVDLWQYPIRLLAAEMGTP